LKAPTAHIRDSPVRGFLNLYRTNGWRNMSDAVRYYGSKVSRAFRLLTSYSSQL
jgi:hypothetical protein